MQGDESDRSNLGSLVMMVTFGPTITGEVEKKCQLYPPKWTKIDKNVYKLEFDLSISGEKRFKLIENDRKSLYLTKIREN